MNRAEVAANFDNLKRAAGAIARSLNERMAVTSFLRDDKTMHARGRALDIALRSGEFFTLRNAGDCPQYYMSAKLRKLLRAAAHDAKALVPELSMVLIEADHVHLEVGVPNTRPPLYFGVYAPALDNGLCRTTGAAKPLQIHRI